ncbi:glycosyltransferase family 2 protein [Candidatus Saccharibacteria bacterium]|nr:glycosyltransferase family 2 protein [Candidatus Saccharibacteria bacterium]
MRGENYPLVTIIVPAYNTRKYISACLDSLVGQSYKKIEIIVIDDGSTDGTWDVINRFAGKDKRIKVIRQRHLGPNLARKRGIEKATGLYTMFVDSDDYISHNAVSSLVEQLVKNDVDVIRFGAKKMPSGKLFSPIMHSYNNKVLLKVDILKLLLTSGILNNLCFQIYRTKFLKNIKAFDSNMKFGEDLLVNIEIHRRTKTLLLYDKTLYYYNSNPDSISRNIKYDVSIDNFKERIFLTDKIIKISKKYDKDIQNAAIYYQTKIIKYRIAILAMASKRDDKKFFDAIEELLPIGWSGEIDYDGLAHFMKTLDVLERIKNQKIVLAILSSNYKYIWKYVRIYNFLYGSRVS